MPSLRDELLGRYLEGARNLAEAPLSRLAQSTKSSAEDGGARLDGALTGLDACSLATESLLQRQAHCLVRLHQSILTGELEASGALDDRLLRTRLDDLASIATAKFYAYRFDKLPYHWRQIYTDALILTTHHAVLQSYSASGRLSEEALDGIVALLDRALITAGGAGQILGSKWIEKTLALLEEVCRCDAEEDDRPSKRARTEDIVDRTFSASEPHGRPVLSPERTCPRHERWTLDKFESYMNDGKGDPRPVVLTDLMEDWPALTNCPWNSPEYLLSKTLGGRRLVPVEVGRSYVDEGWGQELIPFKTFLKRYVEVRPPNNANPSDDASPTQQVGYLAQHNLFQQLPSLRNDIRIPDFCWADVPPHPTDPTKNQPPVDVPLLNAWFGPARTITPLHTDGYHNLLCQVVGTKYVRLYPPHATPHMRPRPPEHGVDMSNTSALDVGVLEGWDEQLPPSEGEDEVEAAAVARERLRGVEYWECVLGPGDTLVIPIGWWHYVRSLSVSFSVSFWWNS